MIRIQVSLAEAVYDLAKREARLQGISFVEFVRRAVRDALPPQGQPRWMRYAGDVESGESNSSQTVDQAVYG
jgi:hypothetical protein